MESSTSTKPEPKFFKIYVGVMLTLLVIFLAALLAAIAYGALRVKQESNTVSHKVDTLTTQVQGINSNLQTLNKQLQQNNSSFQSGLPRNITGL